MRATILIRAVSNIRFFNFDKEDVQRNQKLDEMELDDIRL